MQKTIVLEYNGEKIVSQPFTFKHACIMDDLRYKCKDKDISVPQYREFAHEALKKMFEGTIITDAVLDTEINFVEMRKICDKLLNWFFGIDEEVKNS